MFDEEDLKAIREEYERWEDGSLAPFVARAETSP